MNYTKFITLLLLSIFYITSFSQFNENDYFSDDFDSNKIYYNRGSCLLNKKAKKKLNTIVELMKTNTRIKIGFSSYTDCRGSAKYNLNLSKKRSKKVMIYLIIKGVERKRLHSEYYGETRLVNACSCEGKEKSDCKESHHKINRRTEFYFL